MRSVFLVGTLLATLIWGPAAALAAAPPVLVYGKYNRFATITANQVYNLTSAGVVPGHDDRRQDQEDGTADRVLRARTRADWVPSTLMLLDGIHGAPFFRNIQNTAKLKPSEYFDRQVTIAASFMNSHEAANRDKIGVDNLMWGADFPHVEGTWPRTRKSLARCFAGIPIDDVRAILTNNPARIYGFDVGALQPIADRVGPSVEELVGRS